MKLLLLTLPLIFVTLFCSGCYGSPRPSTTGHVTVTRVNPCVARFINYFDTNDVFTANTCGCGVRDTIDFSYLLSMIVRQGGVGSNRSGQLKDWTPDEEERMAIADLYLQHGANPNYTNEWGSTTVTTAIKQGYEHLALSLCISKSNRHPIKEATILQAIEAARHAGGYWFLTGITKSDAWTEIGRSPDEWLLTPPTEFKGSSQK